MTSMTAPPPPDALLAQPALNWAAVNPPLVLIPLGIPQEQFKSSVGGAGA